jgi:hypothetical protein
MGQLPSFILFDNATEIARFPELGSETTFFNPTITKVSFVSRTLFYGVILNIAWIVIDFNLFFSRMFKAP